MDRTYINVFVHLHSRDTRARPPTGPPHFLLIEDEPLVATACRRLLEHYGAVSVASSEPEALIVVGSVRLTGIVTDVAICNGSGLVVAREARLRTPDLPILIISGHVTSERLNAAHELGASYLLKPIDGREIVRFAERAIARESRVATLIKDWIDRHALSAAEAVIFRLVVQGMRREEIAVSRGVSVATVRNQVGGLLAKVGALSLNEAVAAFFRELVTPDLEV